MRSFTALALGLSLVDLSTARVAHKSHPENQKRSGNVASFFNRLLRKSDDVEARAALAMTCNLDTYYDFVDDSDFGQGFCATLMNYPNVTIVSDYTPTSTVTNTISTRLVTEVSTDRYTPVTTTTVTANAARKRDAQITNAPRAVSNAQVADVLNMFRRQNAAGNDTTSQPNDAQLSAYFSSACECHSYGGSTVVATYTNQATTVTESAFYLATTTTTTTRTAAAQVTTVTEAASGAGNGTSPSASPDSSGSPTSSAPVADPTAPAFSCPEDNNVTVSQLIGSMRYDYLVLCDTDISDPDVYGQTTYTSFSECAAACSLVNTQFNGHVCEGFSFYGSITDQANCFLKSSANNTVAASGVDSALLKEVAVGISGSQPAGTNTESAPFADPTSADPSDISSTISEILSGSSTAISIITPGVPMQSGLLVNAGQASGITAYSTYVSDGTTYSSGTAFSTYRSSNGVWYSGYYSTFSLAWSAASTVYGFSSGGTSVTNVTNSESNTQSGENGDYSVITITNTTSYFPGGYNVTTVQSNVTYNSGGSQLASTATTFETSYATGSAGGAIGASGAGLITSSFPASTSVVTVISTSGAVAGQSGVVASGAIQTPAPSVSATTIVNSYGTAYSTGYVIAGGFGGAAGGSGGVASGQIPSSGAPFTPISSTVVSTGISGETSDAASGSLIPISSTIVSTGISGATSGAASGSLVPVIGPNGTTVSEVLTPISSTLFSTGISGGTSGVASGSLPSTVSPFTNTNAPRSGTESTSLPTGVIPSSGSLFSPISSAVFSTGLSGASSTFLAGSGVVPSSVFIPTGSSRLPFTNSGAPRSGTESTVLPTGAIPSSGLIPTGSSGLPFTNSEAPRSGTEVPSSGFPASSGFPVSSGFAPSGTAPTAPLVTGPTEVPGTTISEEIPFPIFTGSPGYGPGPAPSSSSRLPFSNTGVHRSGYPPSSGLPAPSGTAPLGTGPLGTAPLNTVPLGTGPLGTAPLNTAPIGTGPLGTAPFNTAPTGTGFPPFSNTELPRSGTLPSSGFPFNTAPAGTGSLPSSGFPPFSNTELPRSGTLPSSGFPLNTAPAGTGSLPSSGFPPFSNTELPRSGTLPSSGFPAPTGTAPLGTSVAPFPIAPTSCVTNYLGTTTMWTTVTSYGCMESCFPQAGYGSGPQTFGGPEVGYGY